MSDEATISHPLQSLQVIDRLEVGPVRLEPRRLRMPYVVWTGARSDRFELCYRYEEDVFDREDPGLRNLAAMIGAQVALNYGLFCDRIVFHDPLNRHDQTFLRDMAENTAREIYVNKLLRPNRFLTPEARGLAALRHPIRADQFLVARLVFPEDSHPARDANWTPAGDRAAVLSSGGKDSLLSHALLREMGKETHPIFINESGRHWFTALNAYRHFAAHVPHTARVWTNSDRLFSWMLRHLPIVRSDFARVRCDDYPLRLWTVAVFLFGALPLLKKRNIGHLVIGNEFDTTDRTSHAGIPHYNGLYDQSRFFDRYLTRYFARKGWRVNQFSLLRPMSEMLIEKVLVERYPEMQRLQVSCHAAHACRENGERESLDSLLPDDNGQLSGGVGAARPGDPPRHEWPSFRPCGNCEKCLRIVTMLLALGADPRRCGYSSDQIQAALAQLGTRGLKLERPAAEHLAFLLVEKGVLRSNGCGSLTPRRSPNIMRLRFDPRRSPIDDVPLDFRRPLHTILLRHADGATRRVGKNWEEFDLLDKLDALDELATRDVQSEAAGIRETC